MARPLRRPDAVDLHEAPLLLTLALAAGALDALTYLGLDHVFPANMTGNTVLLAAALVQGRGADATRSAGALGGFAAGVAVGVLLTPRAGGRWPGSVARTLAFELACLAAVAGGWIGLGAGGLRYPLIAVASAAMGAQSVAATRSDLSGVNTTYMTSTLQRGVTRAVNRLRRSPPPREPPTLPSAAWVVYGCGALLGAALELAWQAGAVLAPVVLVAGCLGVAARPSAVREARRE